MSQLLSIPQPCLAEQFRIRTGAGIHVHVRHISPRTATAHSRRHVLYVHGATFSSALSIAYCIEGRSWEDALASNGFHVWSFDFLGFGFSDRYAAMSESAEFHAPLGGAIAAAEQIEAVVRFIVSRHGVTRISIIAHSWGTIAAGRFATLWPDLIERLVLFGPISERGQYRENPFVPAWRDVTLLEQWRQFTDDFPLDEPPPLSRHEFDRWGELYLTSDPTAATRAQPAVRVPAGPVADIARAWRGCLAYDPNGIVSPVLVVRGEWDRVSTEDDVGWLLHRLANVPTKVYAKIPRGAHRLHLEPNREVLFSVCGEFLESGVPAANRAGSAIAAI